MIRFAFLLTLLFSCPAFAGSISPTDPLLRVQIPACDGKVPDGGVGALNKVIEHARKTQPTQVKAALKTEPKKRECVEKNHVDLLQQVRSSCGSNSFIAEVKDLKIVNVNPALSSEGRTPDSSDLRHPDKEWNMVTVGSYDATNWLGYINQQIVPSMRNGGVDERGDRLCWNRSGIASVEDSNHNRHLQICSLMDEKRFPFPSNRTDEKQELDRACNGRVQEFMGGATLAISDGNPVSDSEILDVPQHFRNGETASVETGTLRPDKQVFYGMKDGKMYVIALNQCGVEDARDLFCKAGFDSLAKMDGGHGYYAETTLVGTRLPDPHLLNWAHEFFIRLKVDPGK